MHVCEAVTEVCVCVCGVGMFDFGDTKLTFLLVEKLKTQRMLG